MIDSKIVYQSGALLVRVSLEPDGESNPAEYECYSVDDITLWRADKWRFVGVVATVEQDGVEIGTSSLWSVEHGTMSSMECDAFDMSQGSPAWETALTALALAQSFSGPLIGSLRDAEKSLGMPVQPVNHDALMTYVSSLDDTTARELADLLSTRLGITLA